MYVYLGHQTELTKPQGAVQTIRNEIHAAMAQAHLHKFPCYENSFLSGCATVGESMKDSEPFESAAASAQPQSTRYLESPALPVKRLPTIVETCPSAAVDDGCETETESNTWLRPRPELGTALAAGISVPLRMSNEAERTADLVEVAVERCANSSAVDFERCVDSTSAENVALKDRLSEQQKIIIELQQQLLALQRKANPSPESNNFDTAVVTAVATAAYSASLAPGDDENESLAGPHRNRMFKSSILAVSPLDSRDWNDDLDDISLLGSKISPSKLKSVAPVKKLKRKFVGGSPLTNDKRDVAGGGKFELDEIDDVPIGSLSEHDEKAARSGLALANEHHSIFNSGALSKEPTKSAERDEKSFSSSEFGHENISNPSLPDPCESAAATCAIEKRLSVAGAPCEEWDSNDNSSTKSNENSGVDRFDIPTTLALQDFRSMKFAELWKLLRFHGWYHKNGRLLVSYYYIRPHKGTDHPYLPGNDFFESEDGVLKFVEDRLKERNTEDDTKNITSHADDVHDEANDNLEELNEDMRQYDIPAELNYEDCCRMKFADLWNLLQFHGWYWTKGKRLVNFYYFRPGKGLAQPPCELGTDYFDSEEAVTQFTGLCLLKRSQLRSRSSKCAFVTNSTPAADSLPASANLTPHTGVPSKQAPALKPALERTSSTLPSGLELPAWMMNVMDVPWKELWKHLSEAGWTWNYGTGLVLNWYIVPGVAYSDAREGAEKFATEVEVRKYIRKQIRGLSQSSQSHSQGPAESQSQDPMDIDIPTVVKDRSDRKATEKYLESKEQQLFTDSQLITTSLVRSESLHAKQSAVEGLLFMKAADVQNYSRKESPSVVSTSSGTSSSRKSSDSEEPAKLRTQEKLGNKFAVYDINDSQDMLPRKDQKRKYDMSETGGNLQASGLQRSEGKHLKTTPKLGKGRLHQEFPGDGLLSRLVSPSAVDACSIGSLERTTSSFKVSNSFVATKTAVTPFFL
jgi:hypothetical protein